MNETIELGGQHGLQKVFAVRYDDAISVHGGTAACSRWRNLLD